MAIYFSKTTNGFYNSAINTFIPGDAVEITQEAYSNLMSAQSNGQIIVPDSSGNPIAVNASSIPLTSDQLEKILKANAQAALDKSDVTLIRCVEHGIAIPTEWVTYRTELRAIVAGTSTATALPITPAYPAGS